MNRVLAAWLLLAGGCTFPEYRILEQDREPLDTCHDGLLDGSELGVDCGPSCGVSCPPDNAFNGCTADAQCPSGFCNRGVCTIPSCDDGAKNRSETDIDCGGTDGCPACGAGKRCDTNYDCDGGACTNGRCQAPSCGDGLQNQDETDVDCGGKSGCDLCTTKQHCRGDADCALASCWQGVCQPGSCSDSVKNGDETAVDCGGSCPSCADFESCASDADCLSAVCSPPPAHICLAPSCRDGVKNGSESAIDCGRSCQNKCGLTQTCALAADCGSGNCVDGRCVPKAATNQALPTTGWFATASVTFNQDTQSANALDGSASTHWTSGTTQITGMWFQVDMLASKVVYSLELSCTSNNDYARSIRVLLSEDGKSFSAATPTLGGTNTQHFDFGGPKIARYVKLEIEKDQSNLWWRIDELRVLQ